MNILLIEPKYRSTFPPLGLLRISAFLKSKGIEPEVGRGKVASYKKRVWDKIYISSLFTFELPRTVATIKYYEKSVINPSEDIVVGGVGATLMPDYFDGKCKCKVISGPLCSANMLGFDEPPIETFTPDYDLLKKFDKTYTPANAYFTRVTTGCIRNCKFCAVPKLEPTFSYLQSLTKQVKKVDKLYGPKKDLIVLDNNILALDNVEDVLLEIKNLGFQKGATFNGVKRYVDFNQGLDVRLINPRIAKLLSELEVKPVRIAFDHISVKNSYEQGVKLLSQNGIKNIMTYVMFNFKDTPKEFYDRLRFSLDLSKKTNTRIASFPMRFCPIDDVDRHHISEHWNWRYLRGIQCILNATHGVVTTNPVFFDISFGKTFEEFIKIIMMPDRFIIYRKKYEEEAKDWRNLFDTLTDDERGILVKVLHQQHETKKMPENLPSSLNNILKFYP